MLGPILAAGLGAITFKLGMDAQRMSDEGMGCGEIAARLPKSLYDAAACAVGYVRDTVSGLCSLGCCEAADSACEERVRSRPRNRKSASRKKPDKKPDKKPAPKDAAKDTPKAQPAPKA